MLAAGAASQVQATAPPDHKVAAEQAGELIQLLRVNTPTQADRKRLAGLDLDLAESAGPAYTDVVAYSNSDRRLLTLATELRTCSRPSRRSIRPGTRSSREPLRPAPYCG